MKRRTQSRTFSPDEGSKINGKPVALHGHRCGCGCTLISSLPNAGKR
ncbi:hypothetical protein DRR48_07745 [Escherichia coli]|nr:hypothetical protein [Escherichia coli]EHR7930795.1 PAAR domain-containing protein [Escherichia coli]